MNLLSVARHGVGIAGAPPVGVAIARALAIEFAAAADAERAVVQFGGSDVEATWLARLAPVVRRVPIPPGIVFAVRVSNGTCVVGSLIVAERERDLGDRPGIVLRIGPRGVELDRRDGSSPLAVVPRLVGLEDARARTRQNATG